MNPKIWGFSVRKTVGGAPTDVSLTLTISTMAGRIGIQSSLINLTP